MDALLGMTAVLAALTLVVVLLLMILLAWLIGAKKSADSGTELYRQTIDLSHKGIESQNEMIAVMRELIEVLRSQK